MKKRDYMCEALKARMFTKLDWLMSLINIMVEGPDEWRENPVPYQLVKQGERFLFVDPKDTSKLITIDDQKADRPFIIKSDKLTVTSKDVISIEAGSIETTYNTLIINYLLLIDIVGKLHPYVNGVVDASKIEKWYGKIMVDGLYPGQDRENGVVYISDYLRFGEAIRMIDSLSIPSVPSFSEHMLRKPTGIDQYRQKLFEEYKNTLDEPQTTAIINKKLSEFIDAYEQQDPAYNLLSKKAKDLILVKYYGQLGSEKTLGEDTKPTVIHKPLIDGWDMSKFPAINDSHRSGSYNRGFLTENGGLAYKTQSRATLNMRVADIEDCGSTLGVPFLVTKDNTQQLLGRYLIEQGKTTLIADEAQINKYLGHQITLRSPVYCKAGGDGRETKESYCKMCLSTSLSLRPNGLSAAASEVPSVFVSSSLKKAHASATVTTDFNPSTCIV